MSLTNRVLLICLIILNFSCQEKPPPQIVFVDQQLNLKYEVSELLESYPRNRYNDAPNSFANIIVLDLVYGMNKCECSLSNGLVEIKLSAHLGLVGHELRITVNDSIFNAVYEHYGDIQVTDYIATATRQNLTLNTNDFEIGRAVHGSIEFKGIVFTDLLRDMTSHDIKLMGNFGCILQQKQDDLW